MSVFVKILRWIGIIPCIVISQVAPFFIFKGFEYCIGSWDWVINYVFPCFSCLIGGWATITTSVMMAPSHKRQTALIVCVVMILITSFFIYETMLLKDYFKILQFIFSIIGLICGYSISKEKPLN